MFVSDFTSGPKEALLVAWTAVAEGEVAKGRQKQSGRANAGTACIEVVVKRLEEAAAIAAAASALLRQGQDDHAFALALDLEPLMHDANHALQAAFVMRRSGDR